MNDRLKPAELAAVVETIRLLERSGWDGERATADQLRAFLKERA